MKNISRPQYYRVKRILEMVREGTRTGRYPNAGTFCGELGVSRPTVMRDLDFLRYEENAPIAYVPSCFGYRLTDPTWSLPPAQLSRQEIFAFSIARKLLERFHGTALDLDMRSVLNKIAESLEGTITVDMESLTEHFTVLGEDYVTQDPETWKKVAQGVERREALEVRYQRFDGEERTHVLEPYHLISYHGNWYALARDREKDRLATFAVSRIREIRGTGGFFEVPKGFHIKDHLDKAFGIVRGGEVMDVRLLFSKQVAAYIRERVWHPSQKMLERRDGRLELRLKTAGWKELVRWILSWQPDVKVLAPAALRKRIRQKLHEGLRGR